MGIGEIVLYALSQDDATAINRRRQPNLVAKAAAQGTWPYGAQAHVGDEVRAGMVFPGLVVRADEDSVYVNLQVLLDGNDSYWAKGRKMGLAEGEWVPRFNSVEFSAVAGAVVEQ